MSLKPIRETQQVNVDFFTPWTQERGGCLVIGSASGMYFAEYAFNPSGKKPLGIQLNDVEWMNLSRQFYRTYRGIGIMTDVPCSTLGIGTEGDFETDWIYLIGTVFNGDTAYIGPSGTFTNSSSFGGEIVGQFLGSLKVDPHVVVMRGLGFSREYMDSCTKQIVWENNPADRTLVCSPGFIKVRIDI